jgi:hypothetical protein
MTCFKHVKFYTYKANRVIEGKQIYKEAHIKFTNSCGVQYIF